MYCEYAQLIKPLMMAKTNRNMYGNLCIHKKVTSEGMYSFYI
jgi:hypothetical protein